MCTRFFGNIRLCCNTWQTDSLFASNVESNDSIEELQIVLFYIEKCGENHLLVSIEVIFSERQAILE